MEVVGVVAASAQICDTLVELGLDWKDAPEDTRRFMNQLQAMKTVLSETYMNLEISQSFVDVFHGRSSALSSNPSHRKNTKELVENCQIKLDELLKTLKKRSQGSRFGWERIKMAFLSERTKEAVDSLHRHCEIMNKLMAIDATALTAETLRKVQKIEEGQKMQLDLAKEVRHHQIAQETAKERQAILEWLTPTDYSSEQQDFVSRKQSGTGKWLLDSQEYKAWSNASQQTLFCHGIPGAGKTFLTSVVVEDLIERREADSSIGVGFIYCNYHRHDIQEVSNLLASLLKQFCQGRPAIPDALKSLHATHKRRDTRPSFGELSNALQSVLSPYPRSYIAIDALDECKVGDRRRLLIELGKIQATSTTNIFATSRKTPDVEDHFKSSPSLEIRASRQDVETYVQHNMAHLPHIIQENSRLQDEIKSSISEAVDGMFLLAHLYLNSLEDIFEVPKIRKALVNMQKQSQRSSDEDRAELLASAYDQIMDRINGQKRGNRELAKRILSWITFTNRPLSVIELQHALAVRVGDAELDEDKILHIKDIVSVCTGLVTVDEESQVIRLVHHTAQEHLWRTRDLWSPDSDTDIATACIAYLSLDAFHSDVDEDEGLVWEEDQGQSYPFYEYASQNWWSHARNDPRMHQDVNTFLKSGNNVKRSTLVLREWLSNKDGNGLHAASWFGIQQVVDEPWAENLLESRDADGGTPLSWAAENGQEGMVKRLLEKGAKVDSSLPSEPHPLMLAVEYEHNGVIKLLLDAGADPNQKDEAGCTPLCRATGEDAVRLLLNAGADPNVKDKHGRTPLSRVTDEDAVKLLLNAGANPNVKPIDGDTPLMSAARLGHEGVFKLLLDAGANPGQKDRDAYTPLLLAAASGHETMVDMLLETGRVDLNSKATSTRPHLSGEFWIGTTPVLAAASRGHDAVVRRLLESGATVDVCIRRYFKTTQKTVLHEAVKYGHKSVVRLLLEQRPEIINQLSTKTSRKPPLGSTSGPSNLRMPRLAEVPRVTTMTALSYAIKKGHAEIAGLLKARGGIKVHEVREGPLAADSQDAEVKSEEVLTGI
ncbi:hypothetical protein QQZ08_001613 [Neonectria magnoliae]|uniref:NACHT domain-containing protein n=1 Tax=Neonectria magnoliae TaxID=2732573 RepID=A0ABR1IEE4_9HYPO